MGGGGSEIGDNGDNDKLMTILALSLFPEGRFLKRTRKDAVAPMLQLQTDFEWKMLSARMRPSSVKTSGNVSPVPFGNN